MTFSLKSLYQHYLTQLEVMVSKIPESCFSLSLADDMFSLEMNAKIAANFLLRGYYPLLGQKTVSFMREATGKTDVLKQILEIKEQLHLLEDIDLLDANQTVTEKAGLTEITLNQSDFVHRYIVPNVLFHMGMVYAIARREGVAMSKGDFDGLHCYPPGFSFVDR